MGRADGAILDGGEQDNSGSRARVTDGEVWVNVKQTVGGGGGGGGDVNIIEVGGNAVTTTVPVSGTVDVGNFPAVQPVNDNGGSLTVDDGGTSLTVDGTVAITGPVDVTGSTVGAVVTGTVAVSNFPAVQPVDDNGGSLSVDDGAGSLTVDDGGTSLTVDGTVAVSNFPAVQPVDDNGASLTVDDGGTSLTVDGTVTVQDGGNVISVDDGGGVLTVDGTVTSSAQVAENDAAISDPLLIPTGGTRDDVLSALTEVEGDWVRLRVDANGALWVRESKVITPFTGGTGDGRPIQVASTGSPGTTIHTVPANTKQRVFMSISNVNTNGLRVTIRFGGSAAVTDNRDYWIPPNDSRTIINGDVLVADGSTRIIYASSTSANLLNITGWVETI